MSTKTKGKKKATYMSTLPPLPIGATVDEELKVELEELLQDVCANLPQIHERLNDVEPFVEFDAAHRQVNIEVERQMSLLLRADAPTKRALLAYAKSYLPGPLCVQMCRRFMKDPDKVVRARAKALVYHKHIADVALPLKQDDPEAAWDASGWARGLEANSLYEHPTGKRTLDAQSLPVIETVGALRSHLNIASPGQLGYFLLATQLEEGRGPYTEFAIPKRSGGSRPIHAPQESLKYIQRRILDTILSKVPAHDAAHGFIEGRSIVTNAAPHQQKRLLVKFDLHDFFPTIHYFRVVGLFASLGYHMGEGRFTTNDDEASVAPTLARLVTYTPSVDTSWASAFVPQGAPTSPAIANLVCRGLDARLSGLAQKMKGTYTRYADDLTFSFDEDPSSGLGRFRWWIDQICQQEGFVINQHKFRVIRNSQRQMVTGIVVNESLHVPRKERRRFRAILHNCKKHGLDSQSKGNPLFKSYLQGFASYVHMVQPEEGAHLMAEVKAILAQAEGEQTDPPDAGATE